MLSLPSSIYKKRLWNHLQRPPALERAKRNWNARRAMEQASASGTASGPGTREALWNARRALLRPLYCSLAGDIISVLIRWNARKATGTEPPALERPPACYLLESAVFATAAARLRAARS